MNERCRAAVKALSGGSTGEQGMGMCPGPVLSVCVLNPDDMESW